MKLSVVSILPHYSRTSNYYYAVIDFSIKLFLGEGFILICRVEMRRIITSKVIMQDLFLRISLTSSNTITCKTY